MKNKLTGNVVLELENNSNSNVIAEITDNAYNTPANTKKLNANAGQTILFDLNKSFNWYDFSITIKGNTVFE